MIKPDYIANGYRATTNPDVLFKANAHGGVEVPKAIHVVTFKDDVLASQVLHEISSNGLQILLDADLPAYALQIAK